MFKFNPFKSMTIQGTVAAITPFLVDAFNPGAFSPQVTAGVSVLGVLWAMLGARNAIAKAAGQNVAALADAIVRKAGGQPPASFSGR